MRKPLYRSLCALAAVAAVAAAYAAITSTTGDVVELAPPPSVDLGATESETNILVFQEQTSGYMLPGDVDVNISEPGTYSWRNGNPSLTPATLAGGTRVDGVYFVHFDRVSDTGFTALMGDINFECPVVGVIAQTAELDDSDGLGNPGTFYPTGTQPMRGLDFEEYLTLSADRLTLTVALEIQNPPPGSVGQDNTLDQVRVITACEQPFLEGRMTGGGSAFTADGVRVTKGFEIHCDRSTPNNIQVNWPGNRFHLEELTSAVCTEDPDIVQAPPEAPFDTFTGAGTGRLNNEYGATIEFVFVDAGEPGSSDTVEILIRDSGGSIVLNLPKTFVDRGNMQAHDDR